MGLNNFVISSPRPLPVFILVDASGSMQGPKIDMVNNSLKEMVATLSNIEGAKGQIEISLIKISDYVEVIQPLDKVENIVLPQLVANGKTPIGKSVLKVLEMIENKSIVPDRAYTPVIILISDGIPTDITREMYEVRPLNKHQYLEWTPFEKFHNSIKSKNCMRMALGIGEDADFELLKAFINKENVPVIKAVEVPTIGKFFEWVTQTVSQRSVSANPNQFEGIPFEDLFPDDALVI
ncbi:vWA domain-containing protein [Paenibacillus gallinarum]|uniref:VWA domain-containing protein n=1 Tax=Paenibacillus gallinarum TaxID=2762232 RepID=A0ABR8T3Y7_9BACL|nr:VWA domain-containing protein [Paenibacillus gallinarum]MBD7970422.1 VWA domain-containing protein [Paenibacillus gallinarum]